MGMLGTSLSLLDWLKWELPLSIIGSVYNCMNATTVVNFYFSSGWTLFIAFLYAAVF